MIEVFRTNVADSLEAERIRESFLELYPGSNIHFDLEDSDKILRVESSEIDTGAILSMVKGLGFSCEVLQG